MFKIPSFGDIIITTTPVHLNVIKYCVHTNSKKSCEKRATEVFKIENGISFDLHIPDQFKYDRYFYDIVVPSGVKFQFKACKLELYRVTATRTLNPNCKWGYFTYKLPTNFCPLQLELTAEKFNQFKFEPCEA